jgi:outer membrane protein
MKKSLLFFSITMVVLLVYGIGLTEDGSKMGVVDLQECLRESKEGQKVVKLLKKKKDALQMQLDERQKELIELRKELEKQAMMLTMDAQEDRRRTIQRKTRELEYLYKDLNEEMIKVQEKEKKRILEELGTILEELGSKENFTLIMEKKAGGVLYCTDSIDITGKVIKAYDQMKQQSKK